MCKLCILSDFDGTITQKDGLYHFIRTYALKGWEDIEDSWTRGEISSKECLTEEFNLIPDLSEDLIKNFVKKLEIDESFKNFFDEISAKDIDFYIVSDGIDYFIDKILEKYELKNIKIFSNHGEFKNGKFVISFPNDYSGCKNNAGTCKCKVLADLKKKYDKIIYIGDGVSDYCVADKADIIFAKSSLAQYCENENIKYSVFSSFNDIII